MKKIQAVLGACDGGSTDRDRKNRSRITLWSFLWTGVWLGALVALEVELLPTGLPGIVATVVSGVFGVFVFLAYRRYLREADELRRKIELDALAIAFGVGVIGGMTYWLGYQAQAFAEADPMVIVIAMIFTHAGAVFVGQRRYS